MSKSDDNLFSNAQIQARNHALLDYNGIVVLMDRTVGKTINISDLF
jgi:hypothetical protein